MTATADPKARNVGSRDAAVENAWPGGPCPNCGEDMPARLVRCRDCRELLNTGLVAREIEAPSHFDLVELDARADVPPRAERTRCPSCANTLKVALHYAGKRVACKHCGGQLTAGVPEARSAWVCDCPHCAKEVRVPANLAGELVGCKFCGGKLRVVVGDDR